MQMVSNNSAGTYSLETKLQMDSYLYLLAFSESACSGYYLHCSLVLILSKAFLYYDHLLTFGMFSRVISLFVTLD